VNGLYDEVGQGPPKRQILQQHGFANSSLSCYPQDVGKSFLQEQFVFYSHDVEVTTQHPEVLVACPAPSPRI
jgi:hypothetical protein